MIPFMAARVRRRDASGHVDPFYQRQKRFEAVLRPLGLWEAFAALPRAWRELFWRLKLPDPVVEYDAAVPDGADGRALRRALAEGVSGATFEAGGVRMAVRDYMAVVAGLAQAIRLVPWQAKKPPELERFLAEAGPKL